MTDSSISAILHDALGQYQCRQALLISSAGAILSSTHAAFGPSLPPSIGPIAVNALAAAAELDRLLGLGEPFFQLRRAQSQDLLLCHLRSGLILLAVFPAGIDEDSASSFASLLLNRIEAIQPGLDSLPAPLALPATLRGDSLALLDQLFARSA
ncbi:MAG: hypothetical protein K7J46_08395 [Bryobacter sp.]|jgi:hypothetical protein|nr:hypothetical protein [Bryobacter sp. CoA8 C33]